VVAAGPVSRQGTNREGAPSGRDKNRKALPSARASFFSSPPSREGEARLELGPRTPLTPTFPPNRGFPLPLPLGTGLLIEPTLPKLGIEAGSLNFSLEPAECPVEAFVVLDENFQTDHAPFSGFQN